MATNTNCEAEDFTALFERQFIDGEWTPSSSPDFIEVENPATFEHFARIPDGTVEDVDRAGEDARQALPAWRATPLEERRALMRRFLEHFKSMRSAIIDLESKELGTPVTFAANAHCDYQYVRIASYIEAAGQVKMRRPSRPRPSSASPSGSPATSRPGTTRSGRSCRRSCRRSSWETPSS